MRCKFCLVLLLGLVAGPFNTATSGFLCNIKITMRLIPLFLLAFFIISCNPKNATISKKAFASVYLDSLKIRYPNVQFTVTPELVIVSKYGDLDYTHHIDDDYMAYKEESDSIGRIIGKYVASTKDMYADLNTIFTGRIIPLIKPVEYLKGIDSLNRIGKSFTLIPDKYNSGLVIAYAENSKKSFTYLTEDDLKRLSIPRDSLQSIAARNIQKITIYLKPADNGVFVVTSFERYTASLILSSSLWKSDFLHVDGEYIIAIPNPDKLLVTGSNNKTGIVKLREMAVAAYNSANQKISTHLYKWTENEFESYE